MLNSSSENSPSKLYRIFIPHSREDISNPFILFWYKRHPVYEVGEGITFAKQKLSMLETVFDSVDCNGLGEESLQRDKVICKIPLSIWIYDIFRFLCVEDILSFAKTSKTARILSFNNIVWKMLCSRTFENPNLFNVDLNRNHYWLSKYFGGKPFKEMLLKHLWRIVFIAMHQLERMPSVVHSTAAHHCREISECLSSAVRMQVKSSKGLIRLNGVKQVSCVEFVVYNYDIRSWHRKSFKHIVPYEANAVFEELGMCLVKAKKKLGPARKQGYILYTDIGEKIVLSSRRSACLTFKAFKAREHYLLLCQNTLYSNYKYGDEFFLCEVKFLPDRSIRNRCDNKLLSSSVC